MPERAYLSIGEVLSLLKDEFPDITISKIRFLESQGLLDPERTPSGYRKFYEDDVERLRWILRQQREHFLPLKVIKGRLGAERRTDAERPTPPEAARPQAVSPGAAAPSAPSAPSTAAPPTPPAAVLPAPAGPPPAAGVHPANAGAGAAPIARPLLSAGPSGVSLTFEELSSASGLSVDWLRELERSGFLTGRAVAGTTFYDEDALVVANLAAGFARFGIEARHLRMYKNAAEREAGLFEQIVTPLLKQRNPEARRQALETLESLAQLGQNLRAAMLRQAVKGLTSR